MYEIARINCQRMVAGLQSIYLSKGFEIFVDININ